MKTNDQTKELINETVDQIDLTEVNKIITDSLLTDDNNMEKMADIALSDIKNLVFAYLDNSLSVKNISDEEMVSYYEFLSIKYTELQTIKESLGIQNYAYPFTEIGRTMGEYAKEGTLSASSNDVIFMKLTKDINYAIEQVGFCYGVIKKIIKERVIFRN